MAREPKVKRAAAGCPDLSQFPNFSASGSVVGMRKKYLPAGSLLVKQGAYIYNVSSAEFIYYNYAK